MRFGGVLLPLLLELSFVGLGTPAGADNRIHKIDRTKVVGPPVLDDTAAEGVYIWLEDGWFQLAAVTNLPFGTKKKRTKTYTLSVASTQPIQEKLGRFKKTGGREKAISLRVVVGPRAERGMFKTEGDITVSVVEVAGRPAALYVGPLSKRAASTVKIGRF
jgi:hypothetical protein